jgi:hypothetical protein
MPHVTRHTSQVTGHTSQVSRTLRHSAFGFRHYPARAASPLSTFYLLLYTLFSRAQLRYRVRRASRTFPNLTILLVAGHLFLSDAWRSMAGLLPSFKRRVEL